MSKKKKILFILLSAILFPAVIISLFIPYKQALVFLQPEQNKVLCYAQIAAGDRFKIKYTHSIHLSDVLESYEVTQQKRIRLFELEYEDFAVGMPSEPGAGEKFEMKDGKYFIKNMDREFESFDLRVGKVRANHTLVYDNVTFTLAEAIEPGTRVRIMVKKLNFIQQLEGVNILDEK